MSLATKILVIDDYEFIRTFCTDLLSESGFEVLEAETGKKGIELYRNNTISCVILDVMLPDMDGLEVLKKLRKIRDDVPIILTTGEDPGWVGKAFEDLGADAFFSKGVGADKLGELVEELILDWESS